MHSVLLPNGKIIENNDCLYYNNNVIKLLNQDDYNTINDNISNIKNNIIPNSIENHIAFGSFSLSDNSQRKINVGINYRFVIISAYRCELKDDYTYAGSCTILFSKTSFSGVTCVVLAKHNSYSTAAFHQIKIKSVEDTGFYIQLSENNFSANCRYICFT